MAALAAMAAMAAMTAKTARIAMTAGEWARLRMRRPAARRFRSLSRSYRHSPRNGPRWERPGCVDCVRLFEVFDHSAYWIRARRDVLGRSLWQPIEPVELRRSDRPQR
jgi:hypothetical protein